jgi:hypothetical protein
MKIIVSERLAWKLGDWGVDDSVVRFFSSGREPQGVMVSLYPREAFTADECRLLEEGKADPNEVARRHDCDYCFQCADERPNMSVRLKEGFFEYRV